MLAFVTYQKMSCKRNRLEINGDADFLKMGFYSTIKDKRTLKLQLA